LQSRTTDRKPVNAYKSDAQRFFSSSFDSIVSNKHMCVNTQKYILCSPESHNRSMENAPKPNKNHALHKKRQLPMQKVAKYYYLFARSRTQHATNPNRNCIAVLVQ